MPTYAIGDIQGCFRTFEQLLARIDFRADRDRLWLVGDLVNRGPRSLETLRFLRQHEDAVRIVLGNHDLHLLARAAGVTAARKSDTLDPILGAKDSADLVEWLRRQPLLYREGAYVMVHAGLHPQWTEDEAMSRAREAEMLLRGKRSTELLEALRNNKPTSAGRPKSGTGRRIETAIETIRVLTRIRTVDAKLRPNFEFAGAPDKAPPQHRPWFDVTSHRDPGTTVVFGHWAALGRLIRGDILALDSGCVWGNVLTALRLEDRVVFEAPFQDQDVRNNLTSTNDR
ncbi:MAG: symmetrical bis(5'-nucleosyl)-tetraphosphatase [Deltaproteobacteria bacterium]|nr:symmetrical bis(5'-nucleosyl)-tetraphosphatase [Deltaproteobacteria bacterium]